MKCKFVLSIGEENKIVYLAKHGSQYVAYLGEKVFYEKESYDVSSTKHSVELEDCTLSIIENNNKWSAPRVTSSNGTIKGNWFVNNIRSAMPFFIGLASFVFVLIIFVVTR